MRRAAVLTATVCGLLAGCAGGGGGTGAAASCAGPQVTVAPAQARPGEDVVVSVRFLHEGCADTHPSDDQERPATAAVVFLQGGTAVTIGRVTGEGTRFSARLSSVVPVAATPGPATVTLDRPGTDGVGFTVLP